MKWSPYRVMPLGDADTASKAANPAVPLLTGMLLQEGSTRRDKVAISALLESLGAQLSFQTDGGYVGIHGQSLTKDLPTLIDLMAEQLRLPAFAGGAGQGQEPAGGRGP